MLLQTLSLYAFSAFAAVAQGVNIPLDARQEYKTAYYAQKCQTVEDHWCWQAGLPKEQTHTVGYTCSVYSAAKGGSSLGPMCEESSIATCPCPDGSRGVWLAANYQDYRCGCGKPKF
ncbi:hypothetical protein Ptr902_11698 [Pyrenophora tritici-repentis]|uniref:Uncharacterized protein n=1 Tax=Pyrenophora tritici-repentis TaxID=45151 RepID=A0A5M9LM42_9PLEO|nr:hypothetical protein PtrV1_04963 [Pyrenophora tritici-repentis]KAF7452667.1 hypothetical protein A1F99_044450 [Pyrenophora tritici-repentis]KAF7574194.1 hypothetical protein PtrM4_058170 [Pyrenophora tritici-repentis]KAI0570559.1 hypothetical protein Alg215_10975 [Pyrenophora tritici-repentis]KAI0571996.1 hypothetical protein Alg130_10679 [Pyrenophora tritici-repentis]